MSRSERSISKELRRADLVERMKQPLSRTVNAMTNWQRHQYMRAVAASKVRDPGKRLRLAKRIIKRERTR